VLVAVIGLLLLAALVTGGWLRNYQPMRSGQVAGVDASGLEVRDNVLGIEYRVIEPTPGDTITVLMSLRNDGPLGITIVGVEQPFNPDGVVILRASPRRRPLLASSSPTLGPVCCHRSRLRSRSRPAQRTRPACRSRCSSAPLSSVRLEAPTGRRRFQ